MLDLISFLLIRKRMPFGILFFSVCFIVYVIDFYTPILLAALWTSEIGCLGVCIAKKNSLNVGLNPVLHVGQIKAML